VQWVNLDVPRSAFDQDLLFSFGAIMTICAIKRNDAEKRVRAMAASGFKPTGAATVSPPRWTDDETPESLDLERLSKDQIATLIGRKFRSTERAGRQAAEPTEPPRNRARSNTRPPA
jgi:restriction system protein